MRNEQNKNGTKHMHNASINGKEHRINAKCKNRNLKEETLKVVHRNQQIKKHRQTSN